MKIISVFVFFVFIIPACKSEGDVYKSHNENKDKKFVKSTMKAPSVAIPAIQKADVNPKFPEGICGSVTRRLMECHIEKLDENSTLSDELKKNMAKAIKTRFDSNMAKYISHCKKTISSLDKKAVDICLKMTCKEMDQCLQKTAGKTN
ncbi:hypothetical protein KKF34_06475 [Myxococcota bacterium]|nr:hypothetical protein [Myxococcota bacterium]MBU1382938.1 hypothetical protein [Myxococcota bacterium]MBU1496505.1 hypothetical protein [Myxococcota bacterium]